eukprot:344911-Chlamydomonas_euryale.AAC.1
MVLAYIQDRSWSQARTHLAEKLLTAGAPVPTVDRLARLTDSLVQSNLKASAGELGLHPPEGGHGSDAGGSDTGRRDTLLSPSMMIVDHTTLPHDDDEDQEDGAVPGGSGGARGGVTAAAASASERFAIRRSMREEPNQANGGCGSGCGGGGASTRPLRALGPGSFIASSLIQVGALSSIDELPLRPRTAGA